MRKSIQFHLTIFSLCERSGNDYLLWASKETPSLPKEQERHKLSRSGRNPSCLAIIARYDGPQSI